MRIAPTTAYSRADRLLCRLTAGNAETLPGVAIRRKLAGAQEAIVVGALLGIVLTLLEEFAPQHWRPWLPSTTGLGIAGVIPAFNSIAMFTGALVAWLVTRYAPKTGETYIVPVSSGLIAGESLVGVGIILTLELLKLATS